MILLTGASGFIGKHLLSSLIETYGKKNVLALTSRPIAGCNYLLHNNYNFDVDFFKVNGVADAVDTIIHAGAFTPKNSKQGNDWKNCNQNIYNIEKLISSFLPNLKRIIYLSTLDVYGNADLISEDSVIAPTSLYGHSKLYGEKLITSWAESTGTFGQILRIGHVYGPGEEAYQKVIPVTMRKLLLGETIELWGTGADLRAFIYIDDIVKAILNSLSLREDIGVVNLVSNYSISIKELIQQIIDLSGKEAEIKLIPKEVEIRSLKFDNSKMLRYLLPKEHSLAEGLKSEWDYMLNLN
ncbi:NAD(P)-dependent oxidoreductase [Pedobacter nyackensis]|uniref:NAD-dependent epimerase/dehydratase family protein n=1 Tax=Pedobacter nyackensis TaxID=475255 RepID=UPI002931661F|nr:NAD(P)-dependent oxidoreductase [Pedobacter nyackensis]